MSLTEKEARQEAAHELRFNIGNLPHLGDMVFDKEAGVYIFPIKYTPVELPDLDAGEEECTFFETQDIGEIRVDEETGDIERTQIEDLEDEIRDAKEKVDEGVLDEL